MNTSTSTENKKPITREQARERFKWVKQILDNGKLNTAVRREYVAEVAAFRELGYLTAEEAAPYLK